MVQSVRCHHGLPDLSTLSQSYYLYTHEIWRAVSFCHYLRIDFSKITPRPEWNTKRFRGGVWNHCKGLNWDRAAKLRIIVLYTRTKYSFSTNLNNLNLREEECGKNMSIFNNLFVSIVVKFVSITQYDTIW